MLEIMTAMAYDKRICVQQQQQQQCRRVATESSTLTHASCATATETLQPHDVRLPRNRSDRIESTMRRKTWFIVIRLTRDVTTSDLGVEA